VKDLGVQRQANKHVLESLMTLGAGPGLRI
jgi:hypothetical protein